HYHWVLPVFPPVPLPRQGAARPPARRPGISPVGSAPARLARWGSRSDEGITLDRTLANDLGLAARRGPDHGRKRPAGKSAGLARQSGGILQYGHGTGHVRLLCRIPAEFTDNAQGRAQRRP